MIISAARTAIGKFQGALKGFSGPQLGALAVKEAVRRAGVDPAQVEEVIMGSVLQAGLGQNPARQAALAGGIPPACGALTVNKVCGSGLKAVSLAAQAVQLGDAEIVVAGGMESMSNAPYILYGARDGYRLGDGKLVDAMVHDGLWDAYNDYHMGNTGEVVAREWNISRQAQDEYACQSNLKAVAAIQQGKFKPEIFTVEIKQKKGDPVRFETDEGPRADTTVEALARLKPAFDKEGTVTAGNASQISDGAGALVVTSIGRAKALGKAPLARIVAYATGGMEPKYVMMAPKVAIEKALQKAGWKQSDVDLFEINEAFSVQQCALRKVMEIDPEKHNVWGGGVALGHPIGASGARVLTTLIHALKDRGKKKGIAALCLGGGNAVAMCIEVE